MISFSLVITWMLASFVFFAWEAWKCIFNSKLFTLSPYWNCWILCINPLLRPAFACISEWFNLLSFHIPSFFSHSEWISKRSWSSIWICILSRRNRQCPLKRMKKLHPSWCKNVEDLSSKLIKNQRAITETIYAILYGQLIESH